MAGSAETAAAPWAMPRWPASGEPRARTVSARPLRPDEEGLADLIEAVGERADRDAFARLFEHFAPRLKAFGLRRGANAAQAEELAQDTMVAIWHKARSFDRSRASASTWVFTIVRNKRIDLARRENRPELDPDDPMLRGAPPDRADDLYETAEAQRRMHALVHELPDAQAEVVRMAFFEDKPHTTIAEELGLPLGTVKSRIRLALDRLRTSLNGTER